MMWTCLFGVVTLSIVCIGAPVSALKLVVNSSQAVGELKHLWKSTGYCPPLPHDSAYGYDLGGDMVQNLALIGAVPQGGIHQVRIHWLLDLITASRPAPSAAPVYNFSRLDTLMDRLFDLDLTPGFELMGNPSHMYDNGFSDKAAVLEWKDMVRQLAQRYIDEYGLGYVMRWNFETWNEPDCHDFDGLHMPVQDYLNYYDACSEGLKAASPLLKLGGPGDACHRTKYSDALLDHVVNGRNFFTGETGVRIDFLSYHKKGDGSSMKILTDEIALMKNISSRYPSLANKPFFNDEADPLVGWSKDEEWRADATYAAMVAKIIKLHQDTFISNPHPAIQNYSLLSNDNGFLSWYPHQFTQRTLLARLQINTTSPPHTQFIQKPVYSVMGLLALLGETQIAATFSEPSDRDVLSDELGVLASVHSPDTKGMADSWQMAALVYYSNDTGPQQGSIDLDIFTDITPPSGASQDCMLAVWLIDNFVGNPYSLWTKMGKPAYPSWEQMQTIRMQEGAHLLYVRPVQAGYQEIAKVDLNEPGILLLHVCTRPEYAPDQVNGVTIYNITSGQVLITWSDKCINSRCIKQYEVVYSHSGASGTYSTITPADRFKFTTAFVYSPAPEQGLGRDDQVIGFYKVRAVDYFGQTGEFSLPTPYPAS